MYEYCYCCLKFWNFIELNYILKKNAYIWLYNSMDVNTQWHGDLDSVQQSREAI